MSAPDNAAVVSRRTKERAPHPMAQKLAAAGLDRYMIDDFPTPCWAGRAWVEHVYGPPVKTLRTKTIWEPAANRGFLFRALKDYCDDVIGSDIFDYGAGFPTFNFLDCHPSQMQLLGNGAPPWLKKRPHWIVTNPPFARAKGFIEAALNVATEGIAMLCRTQIMETAGRYQSIFRPSAGYCWAFSQFVERVPMQEFTMTRAMTTMSAYGWLTIWKHSVIPAFILDRRHIPPCRAQLERPDDYRDDWTLPK
jgi:hypothetical protein